MVSRREEVYSTLLRGILWPTPLGPLENLSEGLSFAVPASSCVERDGWRTLASIYAEVCSMLCLHPFFLWVEKTVETQMMLGIVVHRSSMPKDRNRRTVIWMCSSKLCPADPLAGGTIQILYLMSYDKLCAREQASGGQYENAMLNRML
jgi:hypothetical protein